MPTQQVFPGILTRAWRAQLQRFASEKTLCRLWDHDTSLWPAEEHHVAMIKSNLAWLNLPAGMDGYISHFVDTVVAGRDQTFEHLVIVGMGGSNLAVPALLHAPEGIAGRRIRLVDNLDPDALIRLKSEISFEHTLFAFASKSGKRIETHALLLYFLSNLKAMGIKDPGKHFVVLTQQGSYLHSLGKEYKFRAVVTDPPGIYSRYLGLLHFGLLQAATSRFDKNQFMGTVKAMAVACGPTGVPADNPAPLLASFLAAGPGQGWNRLMLLRGPELVHFGYRIAQLVGISTTGNGRGLVSFFGQPSYPLETLEKNSLAVILSMEGQSKDSLGQLGQLRHLGVPVTMAPFDCI
jgi:hypothetical protein